MQGSSIFPSTLQLLYIYSLCSWCNFLGVFSLCFTCKLMWYICVIPCPIKRKVMSSSCFFFFFAYLLVYCGILLWLLGHVPSLIHSPKMLLLDGILSTWPNAPIVAPLVALIEHNLHFEFWFIMNQVGWGPWVMLSIQPWGITRDRLQMQNMKYGMSSKVFQ